MYVEVSVAVNYLLSHLYTKLPRRRVDNFGEELERRLLRKLQPHWFSEPSSPEVIHRCFQTSGPHTDFIFLEAAISSGLEWSEIQACLPAGLVISIDPGHVACQYGSNDSSPGISNSTWNNGNGFNSTSLSSSGCSSASSVSSSNGSIGSWSKTKHQVLYSANSRGGTGFNVSGDKELETPASEASRKQLEDVQTHLATEAALSVLTEPEEVTTSQDGLEHSRERTVGEGREENETGSHFDSGGKNASTEPSGDGGCLERSGNTESQAKSDIENQFPFNDFTTKSLMRHVDEVRDLQQFDFPTGPHNQTPFTQPPTTFIQKSTSTPSFTAATFAATKFGSTKLKNQAKRPHRLVSPCDQPMSLYTPQLLEAIGQGSLQTNQIPLSDRLMRMSEVHRNGGSNLYGGSNFPMESTRSGYYGNYQAPERSSDLTYNNNSYSNGLMDNMSGMGIYGSTEASSGYGMRSMNMMNNPMWSQFEKIRSEFQLKNSQYLQQQQQQQQHKQDNASLLNRNSGYGFSNMESGCNIISRNTTFNNTAPRNTLQQTDTKFSNFSEDLGLSQDLHDLWTSQKIAASGNSSNNSTNNYCWSNDISKSSTIDIALGQTFNALNITER